MTTIRKAVSEGAQLLADAGVIDARMQSSSILSHALGRSRTYIIAHADDRLSDDQLRLFQRLLTRRAGHEPLQHIVGHQEFFKLDFEVTADVLIPRPETELIVEAALEVSRADAAPSIVDIGTGSGCIVISLLHELPRARAVATDISMNALRVAQRNGERHQVIDRLSLLQTDGFAAFGPDSRFSVAVSNPPYIAEPEIDGLAREVRDFEPRAALVSGADGLAHIRSLLTGAPARVRSGGYFIFEIGFGQRAAVQKLIDPAVWQLVEIRSDLQSVPRTFVLRKH